MLKLIKYIACLSPGQRGWGIYVNPRDFDDYLTIPIGVAPNKSIAGYVLIGDTDTLAADWGQLGGTYTDSLIAEIAMARAALFVQEKVPQIIKKTLEEEYADYLPRSLV